MLVEQVAMKVEQSLKAGPQEKTWSARDSKRKAQPASSELEVNAVSASKIRMQTKSPAQEEHVRPRVTFEPLALKDEQSHKAALHRILARGTSKTRLIRLVRPRETEEQ